MSRPDPSYRSAALHVSQRTLISEASIYEVNIFVKIEIAQRLPIVDSDKSQGFYSAGSNSWRGRAGPALPLVEPGGRAKASVARTCFVGPRIFVPAGPRGFGPLLRRHSVPRRLTACQASPRSGRKIVAHGASRGKIGPPPHPSPARGERNHSKR